MKKTAYSLFVILMLMITFTACGKSAEEKIIVGTWRCDGATYVSYLTFNEDMTCSQTITATSATLSALNVTNTQNGTYEIDKGTLMIFFDGNLEYLAVTRFEDDKMIWESVFEDVIYVRES